MAWTVGGFAVKQRGRCAGQATWAIRSCRSSCARGRLPGEWRGAVDHLPVVPDATRARPGAFQRVLGGLETREYDPKRIRATSSPSSRFHACNYVQGISTAKEIDSLGRVRPRDLPKE